MEKEEEKTKKTDSRKFVVWLVWLVIAVLVIAFCAVVMIVTKQFADNLVGLIEKTLSWFFAISMMYLGVNVGQKIGLAFADKIAKQNEEEVDEKMNLSQLKSRYSGIQTKLDRIGESGCLFLALCTIIEEVTGYPADIIGIVQEGMARGWLLKDFTVKDSLSLLRACTGRTWKRVEVKKLPDVIKDNEFTIEKWMNPRTGFVHFKRRFADTLVSSVTVKEGKIEEYYIYSFF